MLNIRRIAAAVLALTLVGLGTPLVRVLRATTPDVLSFLFRVGEYGTGDSEFIYPIGLAVGGPLNRIYVSDTTTPEEPPVTASNRIQVFEANGDFAFAFGGSGTANGKFNYPMGVAVDASGKILVADTDNHRLQMFDATGQWIPGMTLGTYGNFDPLDLVNQDDLGNYIGPPAVGPGAILDRFNFPVRVALRPGTRLNDPTDADGRIAVVDQVNHRVVVLGSMLNPLFAFGGFGTAEQNGNPLGKLRGPVGVGMDLQRIYVADADNHRVQIFTYTPTSASPQSFFGSTAVRNADPNAENGIADLSNPNDVQPNDQGQLIVADTDRSRILILAVDTSLTPDLTPRCDQVTAARDAGRCAIVASDGTVYDARVLGRDGSDDGEFIYPQAVATDALARVVVVDTNKHRFQVFQGANVRIASATVTPAGPVLSGDPVTLEVLISNDGAADLTAVTVTASPVPGAELTSAPDPAPVARGQQNVLFTFTFKTNQTGNLRFDVTATGQTATTATVVAAPLSTSPVVVVAAPGPGMFASIIASPLQVGPEGTIFVDVTVANTGDVSLLNLTTTVTASLSGAVTLTTPVDLTDLVRDTSRTFSYTYTVAPSAPLGVVTFTAGASAAYTGIGGVVPFSLSQSPLPTATATIVDDATAPVTQLLATGTRGSGTWLLPSGVSAPGDWYVSPVHVELNATDNVGVAAINYEVEGLLGTGAVRVTGNTAGFDIAFQGGADLTYWAEDAVGNKETKRTVHFNIDSVAPGISKGGVVPGPNLAGWINQYPTVSFLASDGGSGIASVTAPQVVSIDGANQVVQGTATDRAGNTSETTITINIDTKRPTVVCVPDALPNLLEWYTTQPTVTVTCTAIDLPLYSGILSVSAVCPAGSPVPLGTTTPASSGVPAVGPAIASASSCTISAEGVHTVTGEGKDVAGNVTLRTLIIKIDRTPPVVSCGTASGGNIWPPNHKMVLWNTFVNVTDSVSGSDGFKLTAFSSSEVANGKGDGNTAIDMTHWVLGTPDTSGYVRAERSGPGTGRVYSLSYVGMDQAGNTTSCLSVLTQVPHDQGKK